MTALAFLSHTEREREGDAQRSWPTGSPAGPDHHKPANPDREDTCRSSTEHSQRPQSCRCCWGALLGDQRDTVGLTDQGWNSRTQWGDGTH